MRTYTSLRDVLKSRRLARLQIHALDGRTEGLGHRRMNDVQIGQATAADIDSLIPLMKRYWAYDGISNFDETRIRQQLGEFFSSAACGCRIQCGPEAALRDAR